MKFDCKFKQLDSSKALVEYTEDKFSKLEKYELKPAVVHITFSRERHLCVVNVYIKGLAMIFRAQARAKDFHGAVGPVVSKLLKQMDREKRKVQKRHHPESTRSARLAKTLASTPEEAWRKTG